MSKQKEAERTQTIYGVENTVPLFLQCFARVRQSHDSCGDHTLPSTIVKTQALKDTFAEIKKRGIKVRFITEIRPSNITYCKELLDIVHELRHLHGIKVNFGVSESDYIASAAQHPNLPINQIVHSTSKAIIAQQQYLFQILWEKAIPANQRIKEIEEEIEPEKTEVIYGIEESIKVVLECFARTKERVDTCCDRTMPSAVVTTTPIKNAGSQAIKRGIKTRVITEVTKENIKYCRELIRIGHELRHLDNVRGNFSVSEKDSIANAAQSAGAPLPQLIHSNIKAIIEQQQYFFENLWYKAIPAQQRFKEIEEGIKPETTELLYRPEDTIRVSLECFSRVKKIHDTCGNYSLPSAIITTQPIRDAYLQLSNKGIKTRFITEITKENVGYCKQILKIVYELRHLDNVKGSFAIGEADYIASTTTQVEEPLPYAIHSNLSAVIEQQRYIFETLWNKAIPAEHRIREIEEGIKPEVIETLREPHEIQERGFNLIKSAKYEILIIFSTSNAFRRQEKAGAIDLLFKIARSKDVKIRIMSPFDDYVKNLADKIKREFKGRIKIRNIEEPLQTKVSVLIVDRASLLSVELKSDSKETSAQAIGLATYSNSKATVLSYASIFESLWNQTEIYERVRFLYEQLKTHDKMQQEFIDIAAHELRTPIQPILGLAQVLKEQISDPTQTRFLDTILRNAKRLEQLQEEMLDVTRIESGNMKIYKEYFNLNELISQVMQDFQSQLKADRKMIKLTYKSDDDNVYISADRNRVIQVISNLLSNAIKFTRAGTILVQIRKRKSKRKTDNNQAIISVKDEGAGIDPSIMPRLFTKFASKSEKGTGLGLFISKGIIEAHGGKIWAENNRRSQEGRGRGATFSFALPVKLLDDDSD